MESLLKKQSLSKRLEGSKSALFAVQGDVSEGRRTIVPGIVEYVEHPEIITTQVPAYRYGHWYKNITHPAPIVFKDVKEPSVPLVNFKPVEDVTSIQKLLESLGLQDYTGRFHFYPEERKTRINPINHQGIPGFKQDYVARIYLELGKWSIIWPPEKASPSRDLNPGSPHYQCGALTRL